MSNSGSNIRILIAVGQGMLREGIRRLLETQPDFAVIGDSGDGERIPSLVKDLNPDILLLDMHLHKRDGLEVLGDLAVFKIDVRTIFMTDEAEDREIMQALMLGAHGIIRRDTTTHLLFKSIRATVAGEYWLGHSGINEMVRTLRRLSDLVEKKTQLQAHGLTRKQQQIVSAIVNGCSNRDIAQDLSISERTVKYHLTRIFAKLGVSGRMELARFSIKNKVVAGT